MAVTRAKVARKEAESYKAQLTEEKEDQELLNTSLWQIAQEKEKAIEEIDLLEKKLASMRLVGKYYCQCSDRACAKFSSCEPAYSNKANQYALALWPAPDPNKHKRHTNVRPLQLPAHRCR